MVDGSWLMAQGSLAGTLGPPHGGCWGVAHTDWLHWKIQLIYKSTERSIWNEVWMGTNWNHTKLQSNGPCCPACCAMHAQSWETWWQQGLLCSSPQPSAGELPGWLTDFTEICNWNAQALDEAFGLGCGGKQIVITPKLQSNELCWQTPDSRFESKPGPHRVLPCALQCPRIVPGSSRIVQGPPGRQSRGTKHTDSHPCIRPRWNRRWI